MKDATITFSHNSDEWCTPKDLCEDLGATHNIVADVACRSTNAKYPIALAIDKGVDGLRFPWHEIPALSEGAAAFCNPPHSTIDQWIQKSIEESDFETRVIMLIPASTGTDHWHDLVLPNAVEIQEVKHRISFFGKIKIKGQSKDLPKDQVQYKMGYAPATFDSAIVIFDQSRPRAGGRPLRTEYIQPKER
jgi:hypothetical protein